MTASNGTPAKKVPIKKAPAKKSVKKAASAKKSTEATQENNIVKISVRTSDLGLLTITPVTKEYAREHAGEEAPAGLDAFDSTTQFHFCNGSEFYGGCDAVLTVEVGGVKKSIKKRKLPQLDYGNVLGFLSGDLGEPEKDEPERKDWDVWKSLQPDTLPEFMKKQEDYLEYLVSEAKRLSGSPGGDGAVFVQSGSVGEGEIVFTIRLEKGEKFNIRKLHFLSEADWWDGNPYHEEFSEAFGDKDILLDFVEYNGRFYERCGDAWLPIKMVLSDELDEEDEYGPYEYLTGAKFLDSNLQELADD